MIDILLSQRFSPEKGGSITWVKEIYSRWPKPVKVITHDYSEKNGDTLPINNLTIHRQNILMKDWGFDSFDSIKKYLKMFFHCKKLIKEHNHAHIHCTHAVPEGLCAVVLKKYLKKDVRITCYAHGEEISACESSRQLKKFFLFTAKNTDFFISNSENTKKILSKYASSEKILVSPPGVEQQEPSKIEDLRKVYRERNNFADGHFILLTVGRLEKRKNHSNILRAIARLRQERELSSFKYLVAGSGSEKKQLETLANQLKIDDLVVFKGEVSESEKEALYAASDLFISPSIQVGSDFEGFGIVFIEAASYGTASIGGVSGGQKEAIINNKTGLNVDGEDIDAIKEAIFKMYSDRTALQNLSKNALARAKDLNWDDATTKIYDFCSYDFCSDKSFN